MGKDIMAFNNNFQMLSMMLYSMFAMDTYRRNHSFMDTIKNIYKTIKLEWFTYRYINWKWFRKAAIKKFSKQLYDPFLVFSFNQSLMGDSIDYENEQQRNKYINQYIEDNNLSEEDSIKLKESIDKLVKRVVEERSKTTKQTV